MSERRYYMSLDQGGHATRAIVFSERGDKIIEISRPVRTRSDGVCVELDAEEVLNGLRGAAKEVCEKLSAESTGQSYTILSAGLATQRSNIVCWDRETGKALSPILSWQDRRAPEFLDGIDEEWVHSKTGLFPNPHYGASKMAWCLENLPDVRRAILEGRLMLGPMASYLASQMTGNIPFADPANASRTLLWNLDELKWDTELCRYFSISPDLLPKTSYSRGSFGSIDVGKNKIPLTIVTGDLSAAAFAHGRPDENIAYITAGTGAFVQRLSGRPFAEAKRLLNGVVWADDVKSYFSLEGTVNGAGSALNWFAENYNVEHSELEEHLAGWCSQIKNPPLFLNGVSGLGSPYWRSGFESEFSGEGDLEEYAVSVVESIIFLLVTNLEAMNRIVAPPKSILISGGLSVIDEFCQRLADLSGVVVRRSGEQEGTARGLACLLAGIPSDWDSQMDGSFHPGNNESLHERFVRWNGLMNQKLSL